MKRTNLNTTTFFIMCLVVFLIFAYNSNASIIFGEVVDENGDPIPDLIVSVRSYYSLDNFRNF